MKWDAQLQVVSPVGRAIDEQLASRPRRQALRGFEPAYSDIVDYVIRCTHRIWEQKNAGLCATHYAPDCCMHTLNGPSVGVEAVIQGTVSTLAAFSDRAVVGEDVIWSEDAPGLYLSSHRITSHGTHLGDDALGGAASMAMSGVTTIADCLVRANLIVEEWLVRDNLLAVRQAGLDPAAVVQQQSLQDLTGDQARHRWRRDWIAAVRKGQSVRLDSKHPGAGPAQALAKAFVDKEFGAAAEIVSPAIEVRWPSNRRGFGRGYWLGCLMQISASLHDLRFRLDHCAARPLPHGDTAVALRWSLAGVHRGLGVWGKPSGRDVLVLAVSHLRLRGGLVIEDITVFDELAVLRQIAGGLGA